MTAFGKIYSYPENPRVYKAAIAAKYNGLELTYPDFKMEDTKSSEFLSKFPMGKIPAFEGVSGELLFESGAIAYYAASKPKTTLLGKSLFEAAEIQQWIAFADNEIGPVYVDWIYPIQGYREFNHVATEKAKENAKRLLAALDSHLLKKTFLVGETVTLADITVVCHLLNVYKLVLDPAFRAPFVNVNRWFVTCVNQPHFKQVLGTVELCSTMQVAKKIEKKKEAKPEKPKEAPKPKKEEEAEESFADEKPKAKNPLDLLPPSTMVLDEWKRVYSNSETRPTAVDWFWKNLDTKGYSLWKADYKYNDELTMTFMSSNLVGGFFQRLERARKYVFGSMVVLGSDNNNCITGFFVVRGDVIPPEIYEAADYESYNFVKVDAADAKIREDFNAVIAWDTTIYGKTFADGKIFK